MLFLCIFFKDKAEILEGPRPSLALFPRGPCLLLVSPGAPVCLENKADLVFWGWRPGPKQGLSARRALLLPGVLVPCAGLRAETLRSSGCPSLVSCQYLQKRRVDVPALRKDVTLVSF